MRLGYEVCLLSYLLSLPFLLALKERELLCC